MSDGQDKPKNAPSDQTPAPGGPVDDQPATSPDTASLLGLIDKLGLLLERSDLVELEVEAGGTGIVLRMPAALVPTTAAPAPAPVGPGSDGPDTDGPAGGAAPAPVSTAKFVKAPLTGIFYSASSPTSPPYVSVGQHITVGQVIGLIEAMKLFNEIKSDQAGRVVRFVADSGKMVKAKQPLIEVEP